jgi:hypothetical protein
VDEQAGQEDQRDDGDRQEGGLAEGEHDAP